MDLHSNLVLFCKHWEPQRWNCQKCFNRVRHPLSFIYKLPESNRLQATLKTWLSVLQTHISNGVRYLFTHEIKQTTQHHNWISKHGYSYQSINEERRISFSLPLQYFILKICFRLSIISERMKLVSKVENNHKCSTK